MSHLIKISLVVMVVGMLVWMSGCATTQSESSEAAPPPVVQPAAEQEQATYWPVGLNTPGGELVMYQPQPTSLVGDQLSARAAVSYTPTGGEAMFGSAEFTSRIMTDRDSRMVSLDGISAIEVHLPGDAADQEQQFAQVVSKELPGMGITFPLDQLLASLDTAETAAVATGQPAAVPAPSQAFDNDPPKIIFSYEPATLISINGPPKMLPVDGYPGVMEVVNTPFILLYDPAGKHYYLKAGDRWATTADLTGNWTWASDVPAAVKGAGDYLATPPPGQAATQPGTASTNSAAPAASRPTELAESAVNSKIIASTDPAELIPFSGTPQFTPIPGGQLLYASNTQADVFLYQPAQKYYLLLAGRWYIAPALLGPWQYLAAGALPADFSNIPVDSPKADVLASVPGTSQARDAVLNAEIPQTASVRRDAGKDLNVAYDGQPNFQQVGTGPVSYALNTPNAVLSVNGVYYCCDDAVWYQAPTATGPWAVCTSVPAAIYSIPPSCPDYYATYCYVYDVLPDSVYCGYLPGYTGCYIEGPTVVYGTGCYYGGWFGSCYFPYPCTWGFCAQYDIWTCDWGFGSEYPWWGTDWFAHHWRDHWWRDHWHQLGHRDAALNRWWGPHGYVNYRHMASHNAAIREAAVRGEEYGGRGRQNIYQRPRNVARNITPENRRTVEGLAMRNRENNLFAGRNGDVYRRLPEGWEQRGPTEWNRVAGTPGARPGYEARPFEPGRAYAPPSSGMQRAYAARARGQFRANTVRSFPEYHGGGGGGGGGSHGGGGGGFHGGGGGLHGGGGGGGRR